MVEAQSMRDDLGSGETAGICNATGRQSVEAGLNYLSCITSLETCAVNSRDATPA